MMAGGHPAITRHVIIQDLYDYVVQKPMCSIVILIIQECVFNSASAALSRKRHGLCGKGEFRLSIVR
jgi:hypothetical protein